MKKTMNSNLTLNDGFWERPYTGVLRNSYVFKTGFADGLYPQQNTQGLIILIQNVTFNWTFSNIHVLHLPQ